MNRKEYDKRYYEKNKEKIYERNKQWRYKKKLELEELKENDFPKYQEIMLEKKAKQHKNYVAFKKNHSKI